jgi:O-acetyl-ADP-ribose deacetylase (regulator of RNase III)
MKTVKGDLIKLAQQGEFDVIIHGCNCFCSMKRGIAKTIHELYPQAYVADCQTITGDRNKLGSFSFVAVDGFTIVNGYSQYDWKGEGVLVDYDALSKIFAEVKLKFTGKKIGYPLMGAGLARGDWAKISAIINRELAGEDHTLVEFTG